MFSLSYVNYWLSSHWTFNWKSIVGPQKTSFWTLGALIEFPGSKVKSDLELIFFQWNLFTHRAFCSFFFFFFPGVPSLPFWLFVNMCYSFSTGKFSFGAWWQIWFYIIDDEYKFQLLLFSAMRVGMEYWWGPDSQTKGLLCFLKVSGSLSRLFSVSQLRQNWICFSKAKTFLRLLVTKPLNHPWAW